MTSVSDGDIDFDIVDFFESLHARKVGELFAERE